MVLRADVVLRAGVVFFLHSCSVCTVLAVGGSGSVVQGLRNGMAWMVGVFEIAWFVLLCGREGGLGGERMVSFDGRDGDGTGERMMFSFVHAYSRDMRTRGMRTPDGSLGDVFELCCVAGNSLPVEVVFSCLLVEVVE